MSSDPGILSSFLRGFFHRLSLPRRNIYRWGASLFLFLFLAAGWAIYARLEAHTSACTGVLSDEQIEKLTGLPVTRRSAEHDEEGCSGRYESKHREILSVLMVRSITEHSWEARLEEARRNRGEQVEELDDLDDPAAVVRRKSDGEVLEVLVSRPAAFGRIEVWFSRSGPRAKEIDESRVLAALKPKLASVDAYLKDLTPKPKQ